MSGRHTGFRNRRPRSEPACRSFITTNPSTEVAFEAACSAVAVAPEPKDCPRCDGRGTGCGACGGLGFVPAAEWARALQLAFVAACGLVPPCEADEGRDVA